MKRFIGLRAVFVLLFVSSRLFSQFNGSRISELRGLLKNAPDSLVGKYYHDVFYEFYSHSAFDSAVKVSEEAVSKAIQLRDRKFESTAMVWEGLVEFEKGNYDETVDLYLKALKIKDEIKDYAGESAILLNLASVYYERNNPAKAIEIYKQALALKIKLKDKKGLGLVYSNLGNVLTEAKNYEEALNYYVKSKDLAQEVKDTSGIAIANRSIANVYLNIGNVREAELYARQAYSVLRNKNDRHFTRCLTILGKVYYEKKDYNTSVEYLLEAYNNSLRNQTPALAVEACDYLVKDYEKLGQLQKSLAYQKLYSQINDSLLGVKMSEELAEMQVKYETEKKEKAIEHLDRENARKELELTKKRDQIILISSISFSVVVLLIAMYIFNDARKQRQIDRMIQEKQKEIIETIISTEEKARKKIAADLHDGLGQILTAAKINLANIGESGAIDKEKLQPVTELVSSALYESKNMALNLMPLTLKENGLVESIKNICIKYNKPEVQEIAFNAYGIPDKMESVVQINAYRICQELLNNAVKYSKAGKIFLQLFCRDNKMIIQIEDNGIGFDKDKVRRDSLGMNTLKERVALLKGEIEIDTAPQKGTNIFIELSL